MSKVAILAATVAIVTGAQAAMMIESDWEDGRLLADGISKETTTTYGMQVSDAQARTGSKSCRFEVRDSDPKYGGGVRSEQKTGEIMSIGQEYWAGYSIFYPTTMNNTPQDEMIGQFHQRNQDGEWSGPAIGVKNNGDFTIRAYVRQGYDYVGKDLPMGSIPKGVWVDFVWNIKFSTNTDGFIKCWVRGVQKINYTGKVGYVGGYGINLKFGIYPGWKSGPNGQSPRIIFWDDVRIGDRNSSFEDVAPAGTGPGTTGIAAAPLRVVIPGDGAIPVQRFDLRGKVLRETTYHQNGARVLTVSRDRQWLPDRIIQ